MAAKNWCGFFTNILYYVTLADWNQAKSVIDRYNIGITVRRWGKIALIDKRKPTECRSEQKMGLTGVKWRLWKGRPTKHSTAQNVHIKANMAWKSLIPHRRDLKIERNKIHKRKKKDSTAWKPTARTGSIVTAERNWNTIDAIETTAGQSTTRSTPWSKQGITTPDI